MCVRSFSPDGFPFCFFIRFHFKFVRCSSAQSCNFIRNFCSACNRCHTFVFLFCCVIFINPVSAGTWYFAPSKCHICAAALLCFYIGHFCRRNGGRYHRRIISIIICPTDGPKAAHPVLISLSACHIGIRKAFSTRLLHINIFFLFFVIPVHAVSGYIIGSFSPA